MRTMVNPSHCVGLLLAAAIAAAGGCEPVPVGSHQFWQGRDGGFVVGGATGTGGSVDPTGTAGTGSIDPSGSAGDTGATGTAGSGDVSGTAGTGTAGTSASAGTEGTAGVTGSGGEIGPGTAGTGGVSGVAGAGGRGGSGGGVAGRGGTTGMGGAGASAGRGGTTGSAGRGGSSGTTGTAGSSGVLTGSVMITVTTKAAGGRYQPDNVGAIWIADSNTRFVKSLYVWGQQRRNELRSWTSATSSAGLSNNLVDAVTAATMHSHGQRMASWNGTDTKRALVPDGAYKVCFELEDGASQFQCVDFSKSRSSQTLMPANTTSFTSRTITYTP